MERQTRHAANRDAAPASGRESASGDTRPRYPTPLTAADLRALYARNRSPEVRALLWEVARLRARILRASQLLECVIQGDHLTAKKQPTVVAAMHREFQLEPCLWQDEPGGRHADIDLDIFSVEATTRWPAP